MKNLKKLLAMATLLTVAFAADVGAIGPEDGIDLREQTSSLQIELQRSLSLLASVNYQLTQPLSQEKEKSFLDIKKKCTTTIANLNAQLKKAYQLAYEQAHRAYNRQEIYVKRLKEQTVPKDLIQRQQHMLELKERYLFQQMTLSNPAQAELSNVQALQKQRTKNRNNGLELAIEHQQRKAFQDSITAQTQEQSRQKTRTQVQTPNQIKANRKILTNQAGIKNPYIQHERNRRSWVQMSYTNSLPYHVCTTQNGYSKASLNPMSSTTDPACEKQEWESIKTRQRRTTHYM